jgi:hypothetical protein
MPTIKFSHRYSKMAIQTECAKLLQVFVIEYSELSKQFIEYDTFYLDNGIEFYPLPKSKLLVLLFQDGDNDYVFTTIRRWTLKKEEYYKSLMGDILNVEVSGNSSHK